MADLENTLVTLFVLIFSFVAIPISLFAAGRGVVLPRLAAFQSVVAVGFIAALFGRDAWFVCGMSSIVVLTILICAVERSVPFVLGANASLLVSYTIFTLTMPQVVNTQEGWRPAATDKSPTRLVTFHMPATWAWALQLAVAIALAVVAGLTVSKVGRPALIAASSFSGVWFSVYLVGAYATSTAVDCATDFFKVFALAPYLYVAWPVAVLATGLASWLQLATTSADPAAAKAAGVAA